MGRPMPPYGAPAQAFTGCLPPFAMMSPGRWASHGRSGIGDVPGPVRLRRAADGLVGPGRPGAARHLHGVPVRDHLRLQGQELSRAALVGGPRGPYLGPMSELSEIAITPAAAARVAAIAQRQGKAPILRLSVEGGGCAGFTYRFGLADEVEADDLVAGESGVTLVVDPMTYDLVKGGAVDYVESLGGAAFQVRNPNAASGCGCGSSFSV